MIEPDEHRLGSSAVVLACDGRPSSRHRHRRIALAGCGAGGREGHGDPVGPLRRPAHLRARPPEPVPRLWLRADGGARASCCVRLYAQARGRGAEFYGAQYLDSDRWVRTNGLPDTAKQWANGQSAGVRAADRGVRARAERVGGRSTRPSSAPRRKAVLPLTVEDVYAHGLRVIHYDWIVSPRRLEGAARALGRRGARLERVGDRAGRARPPARRMLMSNSHLQWGDIHTYFEVQLTAPGVTSYGAVWVGFPVLRQCFTEYVGWTQTTNNPAESDLYRPGAEGRRLRARRPGEAVRDAHRDAQGAAGRRLD